MQQQLYFKNLDASRFFAFCLVFLAHAFVTTDPETKSNYFFSALYDWGKVGVLGLEYFFVLSSFLISRIILEERKQTGSFQIGNFLMRRTLRVWPLYFLVIFIGFLAVLMAGIYGHSLSPLPSWEYLVFFLVNFYIIKNGTSFLFFIAFLWSVSIEEQFYLVWAFIMKWFSRHFNWLCWLLVLSSLVFRFYFLHDDRTLYFHTVSALGNFGIGGLLALTYFEKNALYHRLTSFGKFQTVLFYFLLIFSIAGYHELMDFAFFRWISRLYFSMLFGLFIADQTINRNRLFNGGRFALFNYLGKISYGLYCFHGIILTALITGLKYIPLQQPILVVLIVFPIMVFLATVLLSHISYRYFEMRFLQLKSRFYTFQP